MTAIFSRPESEITLDQIVVADPSTQKIPEIYPQNWGKLLAKFWGFLLAGNIKTINEIAQEYEIHPIQVSQWKKELLDRLPEVFERKGGKKNQDPEQEQEHLHKKIGQLTMEVDWLKKKCKQLNLPIDRR